MNITIRSGVGRKSLLFFPMLLSRYRLYKVDIEGASDSAAFGGWRKELALNELNKSL